jgi:hypothetical protein
MGGKPTFKAAVSVHLDLPSDFNVNKKNRLKSERDSLYPFGYCKCTGSELPQSRDVRRPQTLGVEG